MDHRSPTKPLSLLTRIVLGYAALVPLVLAGCQSNAQQDIIARELRMQEDQLYAMEDYLSQYQQLVCKYRSENAALRRQLADGYYNGEAVPAPRATPQTQRQGPSLGRPPAPRRDATQPAPDRTAPELPDVPPLEGSASNGIDLKFKSGGIVRKKANEAAEGKVIAASHEESAPAGDSLSNSEAAPDGEAAGHHVALAAGQKSIAEKSEPASNELTQNVTSARSIAPAHEGRSPQQVWLHGEVVANDTGGGPRLVVDVDSLDAAGRGTEFEGQVSLLLLASQADGSRQNLARWDFPAEEARSALDPAAGEHTMRFYVELPADTPLGEATEVWVRLVPRDGDKLLGQAAVKLDRPGEFASRVDRMPADSIPARIASKLNESDWTIARPGEPANLPDPAKAAAAEWRPSSEPIPAVIQAVTSADPAPRAVQQAVHVESSKSRVPPAYKRPTWTPERRVAATVDSRGTASSGSALRRPAWSGTR